MKKILAIIISLVACAFSGFAVYKSMSVNSVKDKDINYVLYLGTNDKDTNQPVASEGECVAKAETILANNFDGFTIQEARGGWKNDDGSISHEYTIIITLSDTTLDQVHKASKELIKEFNQSSILIHTNTSKVEFYEGK